MSGPGAQRRPIGTSIGRVLVLLVALAGLFAMHGLSDHGLGGPSTVVAGDGQRVMAHDGAAMPGDASGAGVSERTPQQQPMKHGHDLGAAGLCLAVLVVVLLVGWSLRWIGRRPLAGWRPRWRPDGSILARVAPYRPPDLLALSIQRC